MWSTDKEVLRFMFKNIYSTFGDLFWTPTGSRRAAGGACICETRLFPDQAIMMDWCNTMYSIKIYDILSEIIHSILISDLYAYIWEEFDPHKVIWIESVFSKILWYDSYMMQHYITHIACSSIGKELRGKMA